MIVISKEDKYISTTWGASIRLEAGVPKEVGQDLLTQGILLLMIRLPLMLTKLMLVVKLQLRRKRLKKRLRNNGTIGRKFNI